MHKTIYQKGKETVKTIGNMFTYKWLQYTSGLNYLVKGNKDYEDK